MLTLADDGRTVTVRLATSVSLRLQPTAQWTTAASSNANVEVVPLAFRTDPGYREWDLRLKAPGRATVMAVGPDAGRRFTVILDVIS